METPADKWILGPISGLGRISLAGVAGIGRMGIFLTQAVFYTLAPPLKFFRLLRQIRFIDAGSVLVIGVAGFGDPARNRWHLIDPYAALRDAYYQYRRHLVNNAEAPAARPAGPLPQE